MDLPTFLRLSIKILFISFTIILVVRFGLIHQTQYQSQLSTKPNINSNSLASKEQVTFVKPNLENLGTPYKTPQLQHLAKVSNFSISKQDIQKTYANSSLSFEINEGQANSSVGFISRGNGCNFLLSANKITFALIKKKDDSSKGLKNLQIGDLDASKANIYNFFHQPQIEETLVNMSIVGANHKAIGEAIEELPNKSNYFVSNDKSKWHTGVSNYSKIRYKEIYPGIDVVYYGNQQQLEYDFIVAPLANPNKINLQLDGVNSLSTDNQGNLLLATTLGEIKVYRPIIYQNNNNSKEFIEGSYSIGQNNLVSFQIQDYDKTKPLFIDPMITYASFLGGNGGDFGTSVALDKEGNIYVAGITNSIDFPTINPIKSNLDTFSSSIFLTKFDPSGSHIIYSTYLSQYENPIPGENIVPVFDSVTSIAVDTDENVYLAGLTASKKFPLMNAFQSSCDNCEIGGNAAFVTKLNINGNVLLYSTYLGANKATSDSSGFVTSDLVNSIAVDNAGNAYVTGLDSSLGRFPLVNPLQHFSGQLNERTSSFVTKFDSFGRVIYSTYIGGNALVVSLPSVGIVAGKFPTFNNATAIAADSDGNAYITGFTNASGLPTTNNALQPQPTYKTVQSQIDNSLFNAFLIKISPSGNEFLYSSYLGGSEMDIATDLAVSSSGIVYVTGFTNSKDFPLANAEQGFCNCELSKSGFIESDLFVAKIDTTESGSNSLVYSTYLGGSGFEYSVNLGIDLCGNAYISGFTDSTDFPIKNSLSEDKGKGTFLVRFNSIGNLLYSTFFKDDINMSLSTEVSDIDGVVPFRRMAVDSNGNVYLTSFGLTSDKLETTTGAYQEKFAGGFTDAYIIKVSPSTPGIIELGHPIVDISERVGQITLFVPRLEGGAGVVTVDYETFDITAIAGKDYVATKGTLTFVDGQLLENIIIPIIDNDVVEPTPVKLFGISISNPTNHATLGTVKTSIIQIFDDDRVFSKN